MHLTWDLPFARLAGELPEELADLHPHRRGDRVADSQEAAGRADGHFPVAFRDPLAGQHGRLPLVREEQPFEGVQFLVVERIVRLREVDLPPWLVDLSRLFSPFRAPG